MAVPASSMSVVSPSPKNGLVEMTVPSPWPPARKPMEASTNQPITTMQTRTRMAEMRASHLTSTRLKKVTTAIAPMTQTQ